MTSLFAPTLILHITCGLAACAVGLVPIFTRKGSRLHRMSGGLFAGLMATLLEHAPFCWNRDSQIGGDLIHRSCWMEASMDDGSLFG